MYVCLFETISCRYIISNIPIYIHFTFLNFQVFWVMFFKIIFCFQSPVSLGFVLNLYLVFSHYFRSSVYPAEVEAHSHLLWEYKNLSTDSNFFWGCREYSTLWTKKFASLISKQRMLQSSSNKALHPSINVNHGGTLDEIRLPNIKSLVTATAVLPEDLTWDRKNRY